MSYTIDLYRRHVHVEHSLTRFGLFVAYFPQLVAGPIEKAKTLLAQFGDLRRSRPVAIGSAIQLITYGLFMKLAIADNLAPIVDRVFREPSSHGGLILLTAAVFFSIQIYCDFSGYTDIAIGIARLFGIQLSLNFFFPHFTTNIQNFWRTWHISLSSWLREYLYVPLGGNRGSAARTYLNLMITMALGGLWHGASWNFVLWGVLHGAYLAVHRLWTDRARRVGLRPGAKGWWSALALGVFNFLLVTLTWVPFRAGSFSDTLTIWERIFTWAATATAAAPALTGTATLAFCWSLVAMLAASDAFFRLEHVLWRHQRWAVVTKAYLAGIFFLLTIVFAAEQSQQFIYFQF